MGRILDEQGDPRALEYYRVVALKDTILPGEIQITEVSPDFNYFFGDGGNFIRNGDTFLGDQEKAELSPLATPEDVKNLALSAVKYDKPGLALYVANLFSSKWKSDFYPHLIKAAISGRKGDIVSQELELHQALAKSENFDTLTAFYQFVLSRANPEPDRSKQLVFLLDKITRLDSSPQSLSICVKLLTENSLNSQFIPNIFEMIRHHPAADPKTLFLVDKLQFSLQPDQRSKILENMVRRTQLLPPLDRLEVIAWLMSNNEPVMAQMLLPLGDAMTSQEFFEIWVQLAIALKQWEALDKALSDTSNPLPANRIQFFEAIIAGLKGDTTSSQKLWNELFKNNQNKPEVLLNLLVGLARTGEWKILYSKLPLLLSDPAWALKTMETLTPVIRCHRDSNLMLDFYERSLTSRFLLNDPLSNDRAAYNRLILGKPVPIGELEERFKQYPENFSYRLTFSLGLLRSGSKVKSLYVLKDIEPKIVVDKLLPEDRAVYSLILAANGFVDEAQAILKTIPPGSLTRQEESLISIAPDGKMVN